MNPLAADRELRDDLLEVGPYCVDEANETVYCSPSAARTQRAGVFDTEYMARSDRTYCELQFSRERLAPESGADIEACRANLTQRIRNCGLTCDNCRAECTSTAAQGFARLFKCGAELPYLGMTAAMHSSDIGEDVRNRWSANRVKQQPGAPESTWKEQWMTMAYNDIDRPAAPRNSVSCRKAHRESTTGGFVPALKRDGTYGKRTGFMVGCRTDLDCRGRCGEHPVHGKHYVCSHDVDFYTFAGDRERDWNGTFAELYAEAERLKAAGKPHARIWLPDPANPDLYFVDMPGDDEFDPSDGSPGVCTDMHYNYGNSGCDAVSGARATMAIVGCSSRGAGIGLSYCGRVIETGDDDFVTDVGFSEADEEYPRTLVPAAKVNGKLTPRIVCFNSFDCKAKCDFFERTARDGGLPAPHACAMCQPPCPSNLGTWLLDTREALVHDILQAVRLAAICVNPVACACQVFMMVRKRARTRSARPRPLARALRR